MPRLFQPGISGNPKGRPTVDKKAAVIRQRILRSAPEVVDALIGAAKDGNVSAAGILLACTCPPLKAAELPVSLPMDADAGLAAQGRAVVAALAGGLIAPGQAASILQALAGIARLVELDEIEQRLSALEGVADNPGPECRPNVIYVDEPLPE